MDGNKGLKLDVYVSSALCDRIDRDNTLGGAVM